MKMKINHDMKLPLEYPFGNALRIYGKRLIVFLAVAGLVLAVFLGVVFIDLVVLQGAR